MSDRLAESIIEDFKKLKGSRVNWEDHWWDVASYVLPRKKDVWRQSVSGEKKNQKVYDASPIHFNELLASALHSMLTNPSVNWFELRVRNEEISEIQDVKDYLQKVTEKAHLLLNNSNFHSEVHELYLDLGSLGTGAFRVLEDDEEVFRFKSRPIYAYWLKENNKSVVDTVYTDDRLSVRQIIQKYGKEALPKERISEITRDMDKQYDIIHAVLPSDDGRRMDPT